MEPKELIRQYLQQVNIMQLATAEDNNPWVCTVHFYADDAFNLYWVSRTDRNHSQHIAKNPQVSATVVVHENTPEENYVIAATAVGEAELITNVPGELREAYVAKLHKPDFLLPNAEDPANLQEFYCLKPQRIVLFDTKNFPKDPRQVITIG